MASGTEVSTDTIVYEIHLHVRGLLASAGRNPELLQHAALELDALSSADFDATDFDRLERFFDELPTPVDHVMVTAGGPYYARLTGIDFEQAPRNVDQQLWLPLHVARNAKVRPGGTLVFISGTGGRRPAVGMALSSTFAAALINGGTKMR